MAKGDQDTNTAQFAQEFQQHITRDTEWQRKLLQANKDLRSEVTTLMETIEISQKQLAEVKEDIGEMLEAWEGIQGALAFFRVLGKIATWCTAMGAFVGMVWYVFNTKPPA